MQKKLLTLMLSTALCSTYSAKAMLQEVEFEPTGVVAKFSRDAGKLEIVTDNNTLASYQAESKRYSVIPGQLVRVDYSIDVTEGIMSLGALNTNRNGWYGNEKGDVQEVIRPVGSYKEIIEWIVPENETQASLVLRNYHLNQAGQSCFTVNKMNIEIQDAKRSIVQRHVQEMSSCLRDIYEMPKDQRKAYIDQKYPDLFVDEVADILTSIETIQEDIRSEYSNIEDKIENNENKKKDAVFFVNERTSELQELEVSKNEQENKIKESFINVGNQLSSFIPSYISVDKLDQIKADFTKYYENLKSEYERILTKTQDTHQKIEKVEDKVKYLLYSFFETISHTLGVDKNDFTPSIEAALINKSIEHSFVGKIVDITLEYLVLHLFNNYDNIRKNINDNHNIINKCERKIKDLTPILFFLEDLESISKLFSIFSSNTIKENVQLNSTGAAASFTKNANKIEIVTDNNTHASYQAESKRYAVKPGQWICVKYSLDVTQGIISLGALNTQRNGWYGNEWNGVTEAIHNVGSYEETIIWLVPENETEVSLVLRNYHLQEAGESRFTVNKVRIKIEDSPSSQVQECILKMPQLLKDIYLQPKDLREDYITQTYTDPEGKDRNEIKNAIRAMQKEIGWSCNEIKDKIADCKNERQELILDLEKSTTDMLMWEKNKNDIENKIDELSNEFVKELVSLFSFSNLSEDQLNKAKVIVAKYLEDHTNIDVKETDPEEQHKKTTDLIYILCDDFFKEIFMFDLLRTDEKDHLIEPFAELLGKNTANHLSLRQDYETALGKYNVEKGNKNQFQDGINACDYMISTGGTLLILLEDLESISGLL